MVARDPVIQRERIAKIKALFDIRFWLEVGATLGTAKHAKIAKKAGRC